MDGVETTEHITIPNPYRARTACVRGHVDIAPVTRHCCGYGWGTASSIVYEHLSIAHIPIEGTQTLMAGLSLYLGNRDSCTYGTRC